jgi:hypothetical protein
MIIDVISYRDYVPALVITAEAKLLEDYLHSDTSKVQAGGTSLSVTAEQIASGLERMLGDIKARGIKEGGLEQVRSAIEKDLAISRKHEKDFRVLLQEVDRQHQTVRQMPPGSEQRALLDQIRRTADEINKELVSLNIVSVAYRTTLTSISQITPIPLTPKEQAQVAWIDRQIAAGEELQKRIKENPADALALARESEQRFLNDPPPPGLIPSEPTPADMPRERPWTVEKTISERIDEKAALGILGASLLGATCYASTGPAGCLVGIVIGATVGISLHPWLDARPSKR